MIKCNLSRILGERRMSQGKLSRETGLSLNTIRNLYHDTWQTMDRSTMDIVCLALKISIGELLEVIPGSVPTEKIQRRPVPIYQHKKGKEKVENG